MISNGGIYDIWPPERAHVNVGWGPAKSPDWKREKEEGTWGGTCDCERKEGRKIDPKGREVL